MASVASLASIGVGLMWPHVIPVVLGLAGLIVAGGLLRGSDTARVVAVVAGPVAILPALFGAWGLKVVAEGWAFCADRRLATIASYPPDYCERVDWVTQWGIGLGLVGASVAAILVSLLLIVSW